MKLLTKLVRIILKLIFTQSDHQPMQSVFKLMEIRHFTQLGL